MQSQKVIRAFGAASKARDCPVSEVVHLISARRNVLEVLTHCRAPGYCNRGCLLRKSVIQSCGYWGALESLAGEEDWMMKTCRCRDRYGR